MTSRRAYAGQMPMSRGFGFGTYHPGSIWDLHTISVAPKSGLSVLLTGRTPCPCSQPSGSSLCQRVNCLVHSILHACRHTRKLLSQVLVELVSVLVGADVGPGLCIAYGPSASQPLVLSYQSRIPIFCNRERPRLATSAAVKIVATDVPASGGHIPAIKGQLVS